MGKLTRVLTSFPEPQRVSHEFYDQSRALGWSCASKKRPNARLKKTKYPTKATYPTSTQNFRWNYITVKKTPNFQLRELIFFVLIDRHVLLGFQLVRGEKNENLKIRYRYRTGVWGGIIWTFVYLFSSANNFFKWSFSDFLTAVLHRFWRGLMEITRWAKTLLYKMR